MKISAETFYEVGLSHYADAIFSDRMSLMATHKSHGLVGALVGKDMFTSTSPSKFLKDEPML